jgi:nucleoside-diphosphate-sugar epimerase
MLKVAILGANGFIGSRTVEMLHLEELAEVRPIVRTMYNLARLSRFDLDCRVPDAFDQSALCAAFKGCDIIVHAIAGDHKTIVESLSPMYHAAEAAGVRRLVYLSSASVHGQSPNAGTDENSSLNDRQTIAYNNSKVHAEMQLRELRKKGSVEVVMLRPSIVFGPRSYWISSFASDLLGGQAYMVDGGKGICNSIYIDNLIHAIYLACTTEGIDGEAFIVGDDETITWRDFYRPVVEAFGFNLDTVHDVTYKPRTKSRKEQLKQILDSGPSQKILSLFPNKLLSATKAGVSALIARPHQHSSPWTFTRFQEASSIQPIASLEISLLHQCQYKLPDAKARKVLGYSPSVSFAEGSRRTAGWLAFAGYPVIDAYQLSNPQPSAFAYEK